ncbi:MAG TPA: hypothetical protein VEW48_17670, partial [Thermoanaerobaculia bacterium]|nr:hypothetical protein [Thermoanaerobaculia bacterium]
WERGPGGEVPGGGVAGVSIITGSVLWTPAADHVVELAAGDAPVLEFPALKPIDLTETHGIEITLARLEEMAAAYDPAIEMASLNLDHNYGGPSLGWCERIWMQEGALWVRYIDLDPPTVELIRTKRYTRRSAELALNHPVTGGWYFTGCALLGNARPAVAGLPPVTLCRTQYVLTARKETPMEPDPPAPPAPATPSISEAEVATLRAQATEAVQAFAEVLRQNAELSVEKRLTKLGARITPPMAKLARPLLVELLAARTPATVKLQDDPTKPAADVSIAERILEILAAVPAVEALTAGRLADEERQAAATAGGLSEERRRELDAKYSFTTTAFGFRGN